MIKPPPDVGRWLDCLRRSYGIDACYDVRRLHATLLPLGEDETLRDRVAASLAEFSAGAFRVIFDRIERATLRPSEEVRGLDIFHRRLIAHLRLAGLRFPHYKFRPHISLSYGQRLAGSFDIDPVSWRVEQFLLIESVAGRHRPLASFRLS